MDRGSGSTRIATTTSVIEDRLLAIYLNTQEIVTATILSVSR